MCVISWMIYYRRGFQYMGQYLPLVWCHSFRFTVCDLKAASSCHPVVSCGIFTSGKQKTSWLYDQHVSREEKKNADQCRKTTKLNESRRAMKQIWRKISVSNWSGSATSSTIFAIATGWCHNICRRRTRRNLIVPWKYERKHNCTAAFLSFLKGQFIQIIFWKSLIETAWSSF